MSKGVIKKNEITAPPYINWDLFLKKPLTIPLDVGLSFY